MLSIGIYITRNTFSLKSIIMYSHFGSLLLNLGGGDAKKFPLLDGVVTGWSFFRISDVLSFLAIFSLTKLTVLVLLGSFCQLSNCQLNCFDLSDRFRLPMTLTTVIVSIAKIRKPHFKPMFSKSKIVFFFQILHKLFIKSMWFCIFFDLLTRVSAV